MAIENEDQVEEALMAYLSEHPKAAETLEGIADWWLARHQVRVAVTTLQIVLDRLTEKGTLEVIGKGEERCYRLKTRS
jgi:predicted transcriptional regulator